MTGPGWRERRRRARLVERVASPWYGTIAVLRHDAEMSAAVRSGLLWERKLVRAFSQHLRPGGTAIDVGANVGCHTVMFAKLVGTGGRVVAYEPQPLLAEMVRENTGDLDAAVIVREAAAGSDTATVEVAFPDYGASPNPGGWSIALGSGRAKTKRVPLAGEPVAIDVVRLDDDLASLGLDPAEVDLVKVDVEGMELETLRGAAELLRTGRPAVFVETREHRAAIDDLLSGLGYCPLVAIGTPAGADYATVPGEQAEFLHTAISILDA